MFHFSSHAEFRPHVNYDKIENLIISTVFLGINRNYYNNNGRLLVFETIVFKDKFNNIYCRHYFTWQDAEEGHKKALQWVKDGCLDHNSLPSDKECIECCTKPA